MVTTNVSQLISPRSTFISQKDALTVLEHALAEILLTEKRSVGHEDLNAFLRLQDSFQCNSESFGYTRFLSLTRVQLPLEYIHGWHFVLKR